MRFSRRDSTVQKWKASLCMSFAHKEKWKSFAIVSVCGRLQWGSVESNAVQCNAVTERSSPVFSRKTGFLTPFLGYFHSLQPFGRPHSRSPLTNQLAPSPPSHFSTLNARYVLQLVTFPIGHNYMRNYGIFEWQSGPLSFAFQVCSLTRREEGRVREGECGSAEVP